MSGINRVVIVGAGLAALNAAEELRRRGYRGTISIVGAEPHLPYDRPPLSKAVPAGRVHPRATELPRARDLDISWYLGVAATSLDRFSRTVTLADGRILPFDRLLIATGVRAVSWPDEAEAKLDGVLKVRTREDAAELRARLESGPDRVVVVGAGFIGSEVASACRDLDIPVTLVELGAQPLENALGQSLGAAIAALQREHGVDLRLSTRVEAIIDDGTGKVGQVRLSDGDVLDTQVVVTALGSRRNIEWLDKAGLMADSSGVVCDAAMRVITADGTLDSAVYAAGDVARWPHPVSSDQVVAVEHWATAVGQARHAARTMLDTGIGRIPAPYDELPRFWSNQFGVNIKSIGIPRLADTVQLTAGSLDSLRAVLVYGRDGHTVGAVALNAPRELEAYETVVRGREPFPPRVIAWHGGERAPDPVPPRFPWQTGAVHAATSARGRAALADPLVALGLSHPSLDLVRENP